MDTTAGLVMIAACFGGVAWGIGQVERRAKTCLAHNRHAGRAAVILGFLCGILAVGLLITTFLLPRN